MPWSHVLRVYTAGPLAGASYGSDIIGMSDLELLRMRRQVFSVVRPRSQLRSLTTLALHERDPCWRTATAPTIRWSKEIWLNQTGVFSWSLSLPTLRHAWEEVFFNQACSWRSVAGPISALRMSLVRLGWSMDNFMTIRDDRGFIIHLGIFSPCLDQDSGQRRLFQNVGTAFWRKTGYPPQAML